VNLLLDTHALIWWLQKEDMRQEAAEAIASRATRVVVSAASVWEAAIKASLGKMGPPEPLSQAAIAEGFEPLAVTFEHAERVRNLTLHHRDPFDRLLVAQAQLEGLTIVTRDPIFERYGVPVLSC
jgi:PIN domain nuclease of toxin-antitoxin system